MLWRFVGTSKFQMGQVNFGSPCPTGQVDLKSKCHALQVLRQVRRARWCRFYPMVQGLQQGVILSPVV